MTYYTVAQLDLATEVCCNCGLMFAMPTDYLQRALNDHNRWFYCPAGHKQHYTGKSTDQKLRDAEAREVALRDQLHAAEPDAEQARVRLIRDRHRFANGVCPHPDYDASEVGLSAPPRYKCSCGRSFETPHGLAIHQRRSRSDDWTNPRRSNYGRHLTVAL